MGESAIVLDIGRNNQEDAVRMLHASPSKQSLFQATVNQPDFRRKLVWTTLLSLLIIAAGTVAAFLVADSHRTGERAS